MIDIERERTRNLKQLAELWPPRFAGTKTHPTTLVKYIKTGYRGVKLEGVFISGQWVTSIEAMGRFMEAVAALDDHSADAAKVAAIQTPVARRKAAERAEAELARAGF